MTTWDPNEHRAQCETYLSQALGHPARLLCAERLPKSTREAPWRLDVETDGVTRSYVLRLNARNSEHEYEVLRAMEAVPVPAPRAYDWDPEGRVLGQPSLLTGFISGASLLTSMLAGEEWADELYLDTVEMLQAVTWEQVAPVAHRFGSGDSAEDVLEAAYAAFADHPRPLADAAYAKLKRTLPPLPAPRFSNGDLYPDNMIVRDKRLVGVIDFEGAGFSDPIFEFLLPFFVCPELRGRGVEERYCRRMGFDPASLDWYRALEYFDCWRWVTITGQPFVHYTADNLAAALRSWLATD